MKKLMEDPGVSSIRICGSPLSLEKWEAEALRSLTGLLDAGIVEARA